MRTRAAPTTEVSSATMPTTADQTHGAALSIRAVTVAYSEGKQSARAASTAAVNDVTLEVPAGSTVALLGPSGCGKTSLLRAVAGLERPTTGEISIGSTCVSRAAGRDGKAIWVAPERRDVGMVFQDGALFPHLTVAQNVEFGLRARGSKMSAAKRKARVSELLGLVDLTEYGHRLPGTLSGGQQQRVALARSLAPEPHVLLLDEPFSALDTALRTQVRSEVAKIVGSVGVTTLFVTHDQDEAFVLGDHVAVMHQGRVEQFGTPDELYRSPATPWVASFVGETNFVSGTVASDGPATLAATPIGTIAIADRRGTTASSDVRVVVRPEEVTLSPVDDAMPVGEMATITAVEYYGHDVRYEIALDDGTSLAARTQSTELFERGDRVAATFHSNDSSSIAVAFADQPTRSPTDAGA